MVKKDQVLLQIKISEKELINKINNSTETKKFIENKTIIKSFFVENRLINIILK